jgi:integrase
MACAAAHGGARRSGLLRSRRADIDLEAGVLLVREKKGAKGRVTSRSVPLSPLLAAVLAEWLEAHPGGPFLFCQSSRVPRSKTRRSGTTPVTRDEAHDHLKRMLRDGKWSVVRGWHVLRHSFISNCAARGVVRRLIDAWVGHTTEEMRRRYCHLLPDHSANVTRAVFGGPGRP